VVLGRAIHLDRDIDQPKRDRTLPDGAHAVSMPAVSGRVTARRGGPSNPESLTRSRPDHPVVGSRDDRSSIGAARPLSRTSPQSPFRCGFSSDVRSRLAACCFGHAPAMGADPAWRDRRSAPCRRGRPSADRGQECVPSRPVVSNRLRELLDYNWHEKPKSGYLDDRLFKILIIGKVDRFFPGPVQKLLECFEFMFLGSRVIIKFIKYDHSA
jgi:hypothetical protein